MPFVIEQKPSYPIAAKLTGPGPGAYMLPSAIGWDGFQHCGHNVRLYRSPAYTMRKMLFIKDAVGSPGPAAHAYPAKMVHIGMVQVPAYSMGIKLPDLRKDTTPAPDAYDVVNHDPRRYRAPHWDMALTAPKNKANTFPAPNHYHIPKLIGAKSPYIQNPPAFSMRQKLNLGGFTEDFIHTPGANRYEIVPLEMVKVRAPAYTMKSRRPDLVGLNVPGPATYSPNLSNRVRAPHYSLGHKHSMYLAPFTVPEPDVLLDWD
ncbi:putative Outer dense fiber protein 3 [Hypsibius exemplaris]|uniref:Outer dense fiber protein 3 n=1 Tax=Hypsibius exemplaris TaxID=2072580 RepID=A0A9X6NAD2_HYPEX|nr:putative Outer dense fiber protein 3 [Hypsibius exemplaris]